MHEFFSAVCCWENKAAPACWEALLLIYSVVVILMRCVKSICGKMYLRTEISWREIKRFRNLLQVNFVRRNWFPAKAIYLLYICNSGAKILLLMKIGKAYKAPNFFCSNMIITGVILRSCCAAKTRACFLHFSILNLIDHIPVLSFRLELAWQWG